MDRILFHRRVRALELAQTGQSYLPVVRYTFRTLSRGTRAVAGHGANTLRVQSNLTFTNHWLAPLLPKFRALHPDIRLRLSTEFWEPRDMYFPVCAPDYPVALQDISHQPLFDCMNMMAMWKSWAEDIGLDWSDGPVTYSSTYSVCLSVASEGGGLTLAHDAIAANMIRRGLLVAPFDYRVAMPEAYYLIQTPQAFCRWLRAELAVFTKAAKAPTHTRPDTEYTLHAAHAVCQ